MFPPGAEGGMFPPGVEGSILPPLAKGGIIPPIAKGGTIWKGTGWSLGLGLGLGPWGLVILGVLGSATAYGYIKTRRIEEAQAEAENNGLYR